MEALATFSKLDEAAKKRIQTWMSDAYDPETRQTIAAWIANGQEDELVEAFYKELEFGTGGLRGIMGVGSNRINRYTIGAATQGLSNYLLEAFPNEKIKVAIAHDSRNNSAEFAKVCANVFSANGIEVYFFEALRPTPELSFAVRHFGCKSGVVLTASHNPKEYNGYKAYWEDGAQVIPPHDKNIIQRVQQIADASAIRFEGKPELIHSIGKEVDEIYLEKIKELSVSPDAIARQRDLKIVFSALHGTGSVLVKPVLEKFGFTNVQLVQAQNTPDGNFPTVIYPNPEEAEAMSMALNQAKEWDADIAMATDPDADRVGVAVKNNKGEWQLLNGNQTGSLLIFYMLQAWKDKAKLSGKEFIVKTIVTTDLISKLAESYGVPCYNTLTGFKYIAARIRELEGMETFIAGGEESYGYLVGSNVRDKDAIAACAFIAEMAAYAKDKGASLFDWMMEMYVQHGFYKERLISITKKGKSGAEEIQEMMKTLRENPPAQLAGSPLAELLDYKNSVAVNLITGERTTIHQPVENTLQFRTVDGSLVSARPSGTEPKIKFYFSVNGPLKSKADYDATAKVLDEKIDLLITELNLN